VKSGRRTHPKRRKNKGVGGEGGREREREGKPVRGLT
jgi:hypothetical protein